MKRATFSDVVQELEKWLTEEEQQEYHRQAVQYASTRSAILNPDTQPKRPSTYNSQLNNVIKNRSPETKEEDDTSYLAMIKNATPNCSQNKSQKCPVSMKNYHLHRNNDSDYRAHHMNYVILDHKKINCAVDGKGELCENVGNGIKGYDNSNGTNYVVPQSKSNLVPYSYNGYITIEAANNS